MTDKNFMQAFASELLIHSNEVTPQNNGERYEFVLNEHLYVLDCVKVGLEGHTNIRPIRYGRNHLEGLLFELKHVRVNPKLDNARIIQRLSFALLQIGVRVKNQPSQTSMAICYKPLGEISDTVRFYLNQEGKLVFLSPSMRPRLVYSKL